MVLKTIVVTEFKQNFTKIIRCNWQFSLSWKWSQESISRQKQNQFCPQRLKLNLKFSSQIIFHTWPIHLNNIQDMAAHPKCKTLITKNEIAKCLCVYKWHTHVYIFAYIHLSRSLSKTPTVCRKEAYFLNDFFPSKLSLGKRFIGNFFRLTH